MKTWLSSNFIKVHQKNKVSKKIRTLMEFDENQVFIKFHQSSSKFTKIHQN